MVLFFSGETGSYRGFEARVQFENIPGCCRKIVNGTSVHWLSPGYPQTPDIPFKCFINYDEVLLDFIYILEYFQNITFFLHITGDIFRFLRH